MSVFESVNVRIPANDHVYMSSGTWSLMGVEIEKPITDPAALNFGVTNEVAIDRKIRFQKNIAGMWLIMECKRIWEDEGKNYDYGELVHLAENAEPFRSLFNPDDPVFTTPGDMPSRIKEQCRKHGEPVPETPGQVARAIYESLALRYRHTFEALERLTGKSYARLHIVGGGARNALLNQFTADALNRPVHAGPYEATSAGNIVVQMMASGEVQDLTAARKVVASSFGMATILPRDAQPWEEAYTRFLKLIEG